MSYFLQNLGLNLLLSLTGFRGFVLGFATVDIRF